MRKSKAFFKKMLGLRTARHKNKYFSRHELTQTYYQILEIEWFAQIKKDQKNSIKTHFVPKFLIFCLEKFAQTDFQTISTIYLN